MTKSLYFIPCWFKVTQDEPKVNGFAICSSPNDVVTFVYPNGTPLTADTVWHYKLNHYFPWGQYEVVE